MAVVGVWLRFSVNHGLRIAGYRGHRGVDREPLGDRAVDAASERARRLVADLEPHPDDGRDSVLG